MRPTTGTGWPNVCCGTWASRALRMPCLPASHGGGGLTHSTHPVSNRCSHDGRVSLWPFGGYRAGRVAGRCRVRSCRWRRIRPLQASDALARTEPPGLTPRGFSSCGAPISLESPILSAMAAGFLWWESEGRGLDLLAFGRLPKGPPGGVTPDGPACGCHTRSRQDHRLLCSTTMVWLPAEYAPPDGSLADGVGPDNRGSR